MDGWIGTFGGALGRPTMAQGVSSASRAALLTVLGSAVGEKSAYPCVSNHMPLNEARYQAAIALLKRDFPEGRVVMIVRDPRAVFNSLRHYLDHFRQGWSSELDANEFAGIWARQNLAWKASAPHALVRYEDLKTMFDVALKAALDGLRIAASDQDMWDVFDAHYPIEKMRSRQPEIYRVGSVDEWRDKLPAEVIDIIVDVASVAMREFGYI